MAQIMTVDEHNEYIKKKKKNVTQNSFSGIVGAENYNFTPTAKSQLKEQKQKEQKAKNQFNDYLKENKLLPSVTTNTRVTEDNVKTASRGSAIRTLQQPEYKYDILSKNPSYISKPIYEQEEEIVKPLQEKYEKAYKSNEYKNYTEEYYKTPLYQYYADMEKVENQDDFSLGEKAFNSFFGGLRSALHMDKQYKTTDSKGKTVYVDLPNYQQLKTEKIMKKSGTLGKMYQQAMTSIGQMVPSIAAGAVTAALGAGASLGSLTTMGINSYASSKNQALLDGYSESQSDKYGISSAAVEIATEKLFGGLGKLLGTGALDSVVTDKLTKNISNRVAKGLAELGISSVGEGVEELISGAAQPLLKKIALGSKEDYKKLFKDENLAEDFFAGVLSSAILGSITTSSNIKKNLNSNTQSQTFNKQNNINNNLPVNNVVQNNNIIQNNLNNIDIERDIVNFSNQVEKWKTGNFNKDTHLTVLEETPKIYRDLGIDNLSMTLIANKLDRIYNSNGNKKGEYHGLGELVKKLPQALTNPLNIVESTKDPNSIVVITDLGDNNDNIVTVSLKLNGNGQIEIDGINKTISTNVITSAYGRNNYDYQKKPINGSFDGWMELNRKNNRIIYDIDEGIKKQRINGQWLQLPNPNDSFSINDNSTNNSQSQIAPLPINNNMQEIKNNTRELDNSSFSFKEKQLDIILKSNPAGNDTATWIRNVNDIKTFEEALQDGDWEGWEETGFDPDYDANIAREALKTGQITVYSSYPIEKGTFVTPSKMEAESYSGTGKVYSKKVNLTDVAWIDPTQGQYAKIENDLKIPTKKDLSSNILLSQENKLPIEPARPEAYDDTLDYSKKLTRKEVKQQLIEEMNIVPAELSVGNDIKSINYQLTDPIRVNEKVFGKNIGQKINDVTINRTKHNTAKKTRWLNQQRNEIRNLGIKARSKESAAVQKYAEGKYVNKKGKIVQYGDLELASEFSNKETQEKIKYAASVLRSKYDTYIEQINEVITSLGYDAIPKRKDYMRHFQELGDIFSQTGIPFNLNDMRAEDLPTDINGLTEFNKPGKNWFASAQQRTGIKTTYDAITGIDGYLEGAGNLIYHTADIQRYRALSSLIRDTFGQTKGFENLDGLSRRELNQRIKDIQDNKLSKYVAWLDEQANNLAGKKGALDRGVERAIGRKGYTFFNTVKKQVGSNMTGFNVRSSLTNLISSTIAGAKTNKIALVKGTISTVNNMFKNDSFVEKSDFLTNRFGSDSLSTKWWQKVSNAGQIFMTGTDYFTSNQIVRSKYFEGLHKGMSEDAAIKYADDFASRVMGDRSQGSTAEVFNSKTLGLFTQFQLEVNNQWQYMVHDSKIDYQTNSEINGGLKAGATMLFQLGQLAGFSYLFNEMFEKLTGSRAAFDPIEIFKTLFGSDDDDKEKKWDERLGEAGNMLVDNIPFGNLITGGGRIPISEAFTGISTLGKKLTNQKDNYGNDIGWEDVGNDILETIPYYVMPTGYSQAKKTLKGLSMYNENLPVSGSYTKSGNLRFKADESTGGKIKSALFGQYANEEAQKYIDSGFKSINKNNIQEMKDLNMSSTEYRNYKKGLTESGNKIADKINYIKNLNNISNEKKNIMASNLLGEKFDMLEYKKYDSYEEYKYAQKNPDKYKVITTITSYDKYQEYSKKIQDIRDNTKDDKNETIKYINSLKLSIPQKAIFIKQYYKSFKTYDKEIVEYVNQNVKTKKEKEQVLNKLGFTIKDGRVYW